MPAAIVKRGLGDKPGDPIVDSVLTSHAAIGERGRQLINRNDSDRMEEAGTVLGTAFMRPGKIVNIDTQHKNFNAKLTTFSLTVSSEPFSVTSAIRCEAIK